MNWKKFGKHPPPDGAVCVIKSHSNLTEYQPALQDDDLESYDIVKYDRESLNWVYYYTIHQTHPDDEYVILYPSIGPT